MGLNFNCLFKNKYLITNILLFLKYIIYMKYLVLFLFIKEKQIINRGIYTQEHLLFTIIYIYYNILFIYGIIKKKKYYYLLNSAVSRKLNLKKCLRLSPALKRMKNLFDQFHTRIRYTALFYWLSNKML